MASAAPYAGCVSPRSAQTARTVLVLLSAAALLGWLPRRHRVGSVRAHIELLQKVSPIQQFAPVAGSRALFDRDGHFCVTVVAHRLRDGAPWTLVPVDERELAGWLG